MDYISEIKAFDIWQETHPLDPAAINLWHALMLLGLNAGKTEELRIPNATLISKTRLGRTSFYEARKSLQAAGRIEVESSGGRGIAEYRINLFCVRYTDATAGSNAKPSTEDRPNPISVRYTDATADSNAKPSTEDHPSPISVRYTDATADSNVKPSTEDHSSPISVRYTDATADSNAKPSTEDHPNPISVRYTDATADSNAKPSTKDHPNPISVRYTDAIADSNQTNAPNGGAIGGDIPVIDLTKSNGRPPNAPQTAPLLVRPNGRRYRLSAADRAELPGAVDMMQRVWAMYPEHAQEGIGKIDLKAQLFLYRTVGEEQLIRCVERFIQRMKTWQRPPDKYQSAANFFLGGYLDYLDANYNPDADHRPQVTDGAARNKLHFDYSGQRLKDDQELNGVYTDIEDLIK